MGKRGKKKALLLTVFALLCIGSAFALLKTGVFGNEKNFLATDNSVRYDIVADLDGGSFEPSAKPEFNKMDNGKWLHKYKPSMLPTKLPKPVKTGYEFAGWEVEGVEGVQPDYSIPSWNKKNLNIKAHWKLIEANLKTGQEFNADLLGIPGFNNVRRVVFDKQWEEGRGIDVTVDQNGAALAWIEGEVLHISSMTDKIYANPNAYGMFEDFTAITSFELGHLDTSKSTNLHRMFSDCQSVTSLDVSTLDTSNAVDIGSMFKNCFALQTVNLEGLDTSKVRDMSSLFKECHVLKTVDGTKINTSSVVDMSDIFYNCNQLESVDVSNWDTSNAENMRHIFYKCFALKALDVSNWNVSNVSNFSTIFYDCSSLEALDVSKWNTSSAVNLTNMFGGCGKLKVLDVSKWNTSKVTTLDRTFLGCETLNQLDVSNWNTSKVTDMSETFLACKALPVINVSNWDTSKVTTLDRTFAECYAVKELDVSKWKTPNVTDLTRTFWDCRVVPKLDCSKWDTSKVTNMDRTFCDVNAATEINVSGWNTSACTDFHRMFADCHALPRLDVSSFDTSKGTDLAYMFSGLHSLETLDCVGIDTSKSTRLTGLFLDCLVLKKIDNLNIDFSSTTGTQYMFGDCHNLTGEVTVNALVPEQMPEGTDPSDSEYWGIDYMFHQCSNLSGKFIVKYTSPETKELARRMVATKTPGSEVYLWEEPSMLVNGSEFNKRIKGLSRFGDVTKIEFITKEIVPEGVDVSENNDGSIKAYVEGTTLYVASPAPVHANPDCSEMFNFRISHGGSWDVNAGVSDPSGNAGGGIGGKSLFARAKAFFMNLFAIRPDYAPGSSYYAIKIISLDNFDMRNVTNMENMFKGCGGLIQVPVSELKTDKVTNMSGAFSYCEALTDLDLSKIKTPVLQNIGGIFKGCSKLTNLNVDGLSTSKVTSLESVFEDCARLNQINISSWDIGNVTDVSRLFAGCSKLSGEFNVKDETIKTYDYMFSDCSTDAKAKFVVKFKNDATKELGRKMVETKNENDHVYLDGEEFSMLVTGEEFNAALNSLRGFDTVSEVRFVKQKPTGGVDISKIKNGSIMMKKEENVITVASENTILANPDCSFMFTGLANLQIITFDNFDASKVTNMSYLCSEAGRDSNSTWNRSLHTLNGFDKLDLSNVSSTKGMFRYCSKLSGSMTITNSNISEFDYMFQGCSSNTNAKFIVKYKDATTKEIARKMVATKNPGDHVYLYGEEPVTRNTLISGPEFNNLFMQDSNIENIEFIKGIPDNFTNAVDVSESGDKSILAENIGGTLYVASNGRIMANYDSSSMFATGTSPSRWWVKSINFENFDVSEVEHFTSMFKGSKALVNLDLSGFNNDTVKDTRSMFENCVSLTSVNLSGFKTAWVRDVSNMFSGCKNLTNLDFDINRGSAYTQVDGMFYGCEKIKSIHISGLCPTSTNSMFMNCYALENITFDDISFIDCFSINNMFKNCSSLRTISGIESAKFKSLDSSASAFENCTNLSGKISITSRYIGEPGTESDYANMFRGCSSAETAKFKVGYGTSNRAAVELLVATKNPEDHVYIDLPTSTLVNGTTFKNTILSMPGAVNIREIRFEKREGNLSGTNVASEGEIFARIDGNILYVESNSDIIANKDCSGMFENGGRRGLQIHRICFNNFDTSRVVDMSYMFSGDPGSGGTLTVINGLDKFNTSNVTNMHGMFSFCPYLKDINLSSFNTNRVTNMGYMFRVCKVTNLDLSKFDISNVTSMTGMFESCSELTGEITITNPNISNYDNMFQGCSSGQNAKFIVKYTSPETKEVARKMVATKNPGDHVYLDGELDDAILLSGDDFKSKIKSLPNHNNVTRVEFNKVEQLPVNPDSVNVSSTGAEIPAYVEGNTLKVVSTKQIYANSDSSEMFATANDKTAPYTEIVFNNFDTSKVRWLYGMFANCKNLTSVDVSGFNTSNVTDMGLVFMNCPKLTTLDISKWDMSKAVRTLGMFKGCSGLTTLIHGPLITAANTNPAQMFAECSSLTSVNTNGWDVSGATDMYGMFYKCSSLTSVDVSTWDVSKVTDMELMFYGCAQLNQLDVANWRPASVTTTGSMFEGCSSLTVLDVTDWVTSSLQDASGMFWGCDKVKTLDVTYWDTTCLENTASMFRDCAAVTELNVGGWNTDALTNTGVMFKGCKSVTKLGVEDWNVSGVTNMNSMFRECGNLTSLDLSKWNVSKVKDMANMFSLDYKLETLNVAGWNTSSLEKIAQMFLDCYRLQSLDLSSWNTSNVTGLYDLFSDCNEITSIKFGNGWDTSNVTNMKGMFYRCLKLKELDLSMFNTSQVTNFHAMFAQDRELRTINSVFDLVSATDVSIMFANNNRLVGSIKVSNPDIPVYKNMFFDCSCLDSSRFDVHYASNAQSMAQRLVNTKTSNDNVVLAGVKALSEEGQQVEDSANPEAQQNTSQTKPTQQINITLNNGSMAMYPVQKIQIPAGKIGDLAKPDLNPKYAGQFGGYFYDKNCTLPVEPNDVVTQDIELYAKW